MYTQWVKTFQILQNILVQRLWLFSPDWTNATFLEHLNDILSVTELVEKSKWTLNVF